VKNFAASLKSLLPRSKRHGALLGIEFAATGVAWVHLLRNDEQVVCQHAEFIPINSGDNPVDELRNRLAKMRLQNLPCHFVLTSGSYQIVLGEAPKVPEEELAEALRWRIKDLIQFPIQQAIVQGFFLPEDSARGSSRMAYAVATQRSIIENLSSHARSLKLNLLSIDIPELALRNLVHFCAEDGKRGVALVRLSQGSGSLIIVRDNNLYLSRQFNLPYNAGLLDDLPAENLILEVQRSLDYFERQMRQVPPAQIYLCGENVTADKLTPTIRNSFSTPIQLLPLEEKIQLKEASQAAILPLCANAIGAALRQEEAN
jgi:MSHA biogenesis protein MshI